MIFPGLPAGCPGVVADTGGGLSSVLSGSFFGPVDDDLNDVRRTLESKTPDPNAVASQVNDLVESIGSLTCGDEVALALDAEDAGDLEKKAKTMNCQCHSHCSCLHLCSRDRYPMGHEAYDKEGDWLSWSDHPKFHWSRLHCVRKGGQWCEVMDWPSEWEIPYGYQEMHSFGDLRTTLTLDLLSKDWLKSETEIKLQCSSHLARSWLLFFKSWIWMYIFPWISDGFPMIFPGLLEGSKGCGRHRRTGLFRNFTRQAHGTSG